jgi:RNA polymerase sigma factor (sigma-70 family)
MQSIVFLVNGFMLEDKLLIWKFNRGDGQVLHRIYDKYKAGLLTLAGALLYDKSEAEDVVHDVFVSFIESAVKFRLTGSLRGYLATCVANKARNVNKARSVRQSIGLDQVGEMAPGPDRGDCGAMFGERMRRLAGAMGQLPYQQREVIMLHLYSGLKFKQIAQMQSESINTIQGRYRYGLSKLRSILNEEVKYESRR